MTQPGEWKTEFQKVIDHLKRELGGLRTGRASSALVEDIQVEAYGTKMGMKGVGSISVPDSKTIQIEPWDKTLLKEIEKAVAASGLGINPVVDGNLVRISLPKLTEENRKELVKLVGKKLEEAKVGVRGVREKIRESIIAEERDKKISEDERFREQDELEKTVKSFIAEIDKTGEEKEKEIMTV
ncbi:ribosome recycling factor [Candidatus Uhrbacteria bacterium RIFCSPHIGHO2_12_FULL_57_11]|uniref:Ribosome-recycling factor n=2 Tax=Candidatus Uhriibacteriota TaxID=1752732 RepID=A0A1F7UPH8_9BACT|nr:MAG: ribosome recycling factor [Candidatus Uhrbacteria bacterium RIFCSPHIGHO2_02_FULL_57_19]OGL79607.1 MAG: ribosome recycling factor [Candidatus Uhrbacteria bacterium RIFCSPHIGHO2_12_FULL_57_11]